MKGCKYFLNINGNTVVFNSDLELTEFIKNNPNYKDKDFGTYKFSSEGGIVNEQEKVIDSIISPSGNNAVWSKTFMPESTFFKEKHSIDGKPPEYLAPVLLDDEYIEQGSKELAKTKYKNYERDEALKLAKEEIERDLEFDKMIPEFSKRINNIFNAFFEYKSPKYIDKNLNELIELWKEYNNKIDSESDSDVKFTYDDELIERIKENIKSKIGKWRDNVVADKSNKFLSNVWLNRSQSIGASNGITSPSFLMSISNDESPIINLYELKISRNKYEEWHSAKKLRVDYKLGLNRQLVDGMVPGTVDMNNSSLYILPIWLPTNEHGHLMLENFAINSLQERTSPTIHGDSMLDSTGIITTNLKKLFPIATKENLKESEEASKTIERILGVAFPKYNFRTRVRTATVESLLEMAHRNAKNSTKIQLLNRTTGKKIIHDNTPEGIKKFEEEVIKYVEDLDKNKDKVVLNSIKTIVAAKKNGRFIGNKISDGFIRTFSKYLSPEWEMVTNANHLTQNGIILFKNIKSLIVEPVVITVNNLDQITNMGLGTTIVGKFQRDSDFKTDTQIWNASNKNVEVMKTLLVLNSSPSLLNNYKLGSVHIYDNLTGRSDTSLVFNDESYNFNLLFDHISKDLPLTNNFKNGKIKKADFLDVLYSEILEKLIPIDNSTLMSEFEQIPFDDIHTNLERLEHFKKFQKAIESQYPQYEHGLGVRVSDYDKDIDYVYALVSQGITAFSNIKNDYDIGAPNLGITQEDLLNPIKATFGKKGAPKHDKKGNKIVGMFQGYQFSTSDTLPSNFAKKMMSVVMLAMNRLTVDYNNFKNPVINTTKSMYKELGRSDLEKLFIGESDRFYEPFFKKDGSKISQDFELLNPWDDTPELNTLQRKYLKKFIYHLYRAGKTFNTELDTYEKFEKSLELQEMLTNGDIYKLLRVPLIKRKSASITKTITTDGFWKFIGNTKDSILNELDYRDATGAEIEYEQQVGMLEEANRLGKVYNRFNAQIHNDTYRAGLIEEHGVGHWEINLDTIILSFGYENMKEDYMNQAMISIKAATEALKLWASQHGRTEEAERVISNIIEQLKVSVYNISPLKGKESERFFALVRHAQKATSLLVLALRPAMAIKELVVGTIRNVSYSWSKVYGDDSFKGEHLTKAYELLFGESSWDIVNAINNLYRVANRDLNHIVDKTKVDRHGINFFGSFLYWSNTAPDYINRLALFLSKTIKDGSYEAHSLDEEGNLIYDARKDKRFAYYLEMRDKYGYVIHKTDTKFNDQRALYLAQIKTFNEEAIFENDKFLEEKDLLPQAYTNKEKESIVTFTSMAYGYYDHERTPLIKHLPMGIMFGQFMTFWPAKVKYYFAPEGSIADRGRFNHKHKVVDGEKVYYYMKYSKDANGDIYMEEVPESELKPEDGRMKAIEWVGEPMEGLMTSLGLTARHLFTAKSFDGIDPQRLANASLMLHDLLTAMISMLIGIYLFKRVGDIDLKVDRGEKTKWSEMGHYERIGARIMMSATNEFDPFSLMGSISATPTFINTLGKVKKDLNSLFLGHSDVETFFRNNFRFLENVPNPMARN